MAERMGKLKVLVTGAGGQLGRALMLTTPESVSPTWALRSDCDMEAESLPVLPSDIDVVVNCAAYTAVDEAEKNPHTAELVNHHGVAALAQRCAEAGAHLIHISTDYVFGSPKVHRPLTPQDSPEPESVYGRTKLAGERAVLNSEADATVIRTAWLYSGRVLPEHRDFVSTMIRLESQQEYISVVDDQHGSPTFAVDLARELWQAVHTRPGGILHAVGAGQASWWEVAQEVFSQLGADPSRVLPISSREYQTQGSHVTMASRPLWSVLSSDFPLPEWRSGIRRAVAGSMSPL